MVQVFEEDVRPHSPSICVVPGCGDKADARGLCKMHYARWKKYGDPGEAGRRKAEDGQTPHGTASRYINFDCRCDDCRKAGHEYFRLWEKGRTIQDAEATRTRRPYVRAVSFTSSVD